MAIDDYRNSMKKKSPKIAIEATAYHEAGHAAMYFSQQQKFRYVTIVSNSDKGSLGHIAHEKLSGFRPDLNDDWRTRRKLESVILCTLAGAAAEGVFRGRHNWRGARSDLRYVTAVALCFYPEASEASAFISWLWIRANNIVKSRWRMIEAIAAALLERKTLTYKESQSAILDYATTRPRHS